MGTKPLTTNIDEHIKAALDFFCEGKGIEISNFLEDAILDKLEEFEDVSYLRKRRHESFKPFDEVLKELKTGGKL